MILLARNIMFNHALVYSCLIVVIAGSEPCADLDPMGCANNPNLCDDPILAKDICANSCNLCQMHTATTTTAKSLTTTTTTTTKSPTILTTEKPSTTKESTTKYGQVMDGGWSEWSTSGACSKTCGHGALTQRHRTCTNPSPANGGNTCSGPNLKFYNCPFVNCPDAVLDGTWKDWGKWSDCFGQCGVAKRYRFRDCVTSVNNGTCAGEKIGSTPCSDPCNVVYTTLPPTTTASPTTTTTTRATTTSSSAFWKDWEEWSKCFGQCGVAKRFRFRDCVTSGNNDTCVGEKIGSTPCSDPCNVVQTTLPPPPTTTAAPATTTTTMATTTESIKCPTSWVRRDGSCYYFSTTLQSWASAKAYCNSHGADLVKIDNKAEQDYLVAVVSQFGMGLWWTSGRAVGHTHYVWKWKGKDITFTYSDWAVEGQFNTAKQCVAMFQAYSYKWVIGPCEEAIDWICEMDFPTTVSVLNTTPTPSIHPSQHTPGQTTCPESWIKHFSSCYYFGLSKRSWTSSKTFCNSFHGDLVKIDNAYEDNYLVSVLRHRATSIAWIGGKATAFGGHFVWMWGNSEIPFRYTNWLPGEPNDYHFTDACAAIRNSTAGYYWEDGRCVSLQNFICEISLHEGIILIG
ncbi:uncharacterized protein LOC128222951 [Mya arenaria]|uniref:uncharacterized protein LOC128222951 n=1 Tax=Mya arenaria TaxID=6604 RepID=UPI0022DED46F|nr:uncharacterized protein LOC128222951 [Mya arenaria]